MIPIFTLPFLPISSPTSLQDSATEGNCLPLILDLRCSRRLMQQAPFVLDNVRTKTKRIAVHSGELCETLCCKLSRDDIDQELPVGRYFREPKDQVGGILGNILTNQHDGRAQPPQISRHCQILAPHARPINPHAET